MGDLQNTLLFGAAPQPAPARPAEQPLARQAKRRVVFGFWPGEIIGFGPGLRIRVVAGLGSCLKPGQDCVQGEIGGARHPQQRLGMGLAARTQGVMSGPIRVGSDLQDSQQRRVELRRGSIGREPGFQTGGQVAGGQPVGGERQSPTGMVGGTQIV